MIAHRTFTAAIAEATSREQCKVACECRTFNNQHTRLAAVLSNGTVIVHFDGLEWRTPTGRDFFDAYKAGGVLERDGMTTELDPGEKPWTSGWAVVTPDLPGPKTIPCPQCGARWRVDWARVLRLVLSTKKTVSVSTVATRVQ